MPRWRLLDDLHAPPRAAAGQMEADLALLGSVAAGREPALRLYRWAPPALSLGRFQPASDVDGDTCARLGVEIVRRPSGGRGLLHGADLTYAVALPRPPGASGRVSAVYELVAGALIAGLARLGVTASVARRDGPAGPVCFAAQQGADLRVGDRKLCGSAQARRDGAVLQHGSILLTRFEFDETDLLRAPADGPPLDRAGLRAATVTLEELGAPAGASEVAAALLEGFRDTLDVEFMSQDEA
jgi:lipoate-protein ligase A